ncbi:MAG: CHAP domain-containing protein [Candidatus Riflebacteria bacterium]|nr:CHAP domain-containing protein [Candidatus Riflebacteria bacterium]
MHRLIVPLLCLFIIVTAVFFTGCWHSGNGNISGAITPPAGEKFEKLAGSVKFQFKIPPGKKASILPTVATLTPQVTFSLSEINAGDLASRTTEIVQVSQVASDGSAQTTFFGVPAKTVVGEVHIEGGSISGFTDFRGASDLVVGINNYITVAPKNSGDPEDIIGFVIQKLVSQDYLFQKVGSGLAMAVRDAAKDVGVNSNVVYDDVVSIFFRKVSENSNTITLATNARVLSAEGTTSVNSCCNPTGTETYQIYFSSPSAELACIQPGEILISNDLMGASEGDQSGGFIRKVTEVSSSADQLIITAKNAKLEEVITNGTLECYEPVVQESPFASRRRSKRALVIDGGILRTMNLNHSFDVGDYGKLDCDLNVQARMYFKLDIKLNEIKEFLIRFDVDESAKVLFSTSISESFSKTGGTQPLYLTTIYLTGSGFVIPIDIYGSLVYEVSGEAAANLQVGLEQTLSASIGARRYLGVWEPISSFNFALTPIYDANMNVTFKVAAGPKFNARVLFDVGPNASLLGQAKLDLFNSRNAPSLRKQTKLDLFPEQRMTGNFIANVGASMKITDALQIEKTFSYETPEKLIWPAAQSQNIPPVVEITSPKDGSIYNAGSDLQIIASATDFDGQISKVEFYSDGKYLGETHQFPYIIPQQSLAVGNHILTACAYDDKNDKMTSVGISIVVNPPGDSIPEISGIEPASIYGGDYNQSITVIGKNFQSGITNIVADSCRPYSKKPCTFINSEKISISRNFGTESDNWQLTLFNPDGKSTKEPFSFLVIGKEKKPYGTPLGNFNNVEVYSNNQAPASQDVNLSGGVETGLKWECPEFVNRYYKVIYNTNLRSKSKANASSYYTLADTFGLSHYKNGESEIPKIGDILCFGGGKGGRGHVAIVREVSPQASAIYVTQQNVRQNEGDLYFNLPLISSGGKYTVDCISQGGGSRLDLPDCLAEEKHYCQGWLRKPPQEVVQTPKVNSVTPNPIVGSSEVQTLTINGENFSNDCIVALTNKTGNTLSTPTILYLNSAQIQINQMFGTTASTWELVVKRNNLPSNVIPLTVQPQALQPTIARVSPSPVTGSSNPQDFTIIGKNFETGCKVDLRDLSSGEAPFLDRAIKSFSTTNIVITPKFTEAEHKWSVEVRNPGGASSGQYPFQVVAPVVVPDLTGISPTTLLSQDDYQTIYLTGTSFQNGATVRLRNSDTGTAKDYSPSSVGSTQIVLQAKLSGGKANWTAQVLNPNGQTSKPLPFQVNAQPITPHVSSVSPSNVFGSGSSKAMALFGSDFQLGCAINLFCTSENKWYPVSCTTFSATKMTFNATYGNVTDVWKVVVVNPGGVSSTEIMEINVTRQDFMAPKISSPGTISDTNYKSLSLTPTFTWAGVSGADHYGFYISQTPYGSPNIIYSNTSLFGTSFTIPSGKLKNKTKYRWNMTSFMSVNGIMTETNACSPLYFTTP